MASLWFSVYGLAFFVFHYSLSLYLASFSLLLRPKFLTASFTFTDCYAPLPYHLCSPLPFFYNFKWTFLFCFAIIQLGHPGIAQLVARQLWDPTRFHPRPISLIPATASHPKRRRQPPLANLFAKTPQDPRFDYLRFSFCIPPSPPNTPLPFS